MGDGRHVPALLDAVVSTDERTRIAALFALRLLSGVTLPGRIKRWESWWKHAEVQGRRDLRLALEQMEAGTDSANALLWRGVAQRTAWIDIEHARNAVATWLQGSDIRLHAEAAILVGHLRLADQGDRLEQVARRTRVTATRMMMEEVLTSLGHEARKALSYPRGSRREVGPGLGGLPMPRLGAVLPSRGALPHISSPANASLPR